MSHKMQIYAGYSEPDLAILAQFHNAAARPEQGFVVDFLGVRHRLSALWPEARRLDGQVLGQPVPSDFHAETVEWVGALKSVAAATDRFVAMRDLLEREPEWNLVHIDVQGHEFDIIRSSIDLLSARVRWMIVGTHSRKLDGDVLDIMSKAGWVLEHEKPTRFDFWQNPVSLEAMTTQDGTQVWRNPRFA
jgi:hypothetical protein